MSVAVVTPVAIGVGIDTARYGHHATFLRPDLQPAGANLTFAESAARATHNLKLGCVPGFEWR